MYNINPTIKTNKNNSIICCYDQNLKKNVCGDS